MNAPPILTAGIPVDDEASPAGWRVVFVSILAMMIGPPPVLIMSFGMILPQFQAAFGWSVQQISLGATLISAMLVIIAPLQGHLTDRFGCRAMILVSIPLFGAGVLSMAFLGPRIGFYYAASVLLPFAGLGLWPLTYMKMVSTWFERQLGFALGCLNLGNGLGGAVMPLFLGIVFALYGWRSAYLILGAANLLVAWPLAALMLRERPADLAAGGRIAVAEEAYGLSLGEALQTRSFATMAAGFCVIGVLSTAFLVHQFGILVGAGLSPRAATYLQACLGLSSIVGQLAAGWCMDRLAAGRIVAIMLGMIVLACVVYASPLAAVLAPVCVAMVGLMIGAEMNILGYMTKRHFGERAFGRIYGIVFACFSLGGAAGAQILATSQTCWNSYGPGLYTVAALCCTVAVLFARMPAYRYQPPTGPSVTH